MAAVVGFVIGTPLITVPFLRADAATLRVILAVVVPPTLVLVLGSLALSIRTTRVTLLPGAIEVRTWRSCDRFELDDTFRAGEIGAPAHLGGATASPSLAFASTRSGRRVQLGVEAFSPEDVAAIRAHVGDRLRSVTLSVDSAGETALLPWWQRRPWLSGCLLVIVLLVVVIGAATAYALVLGVDS